MIPLGVMLELIRASEVDRLVALDRARDDRQYDAELQIDKAIVAGTRALAVDPDLPRRIKVTLENMTSPILAGVLARYRGEGDWQTLATSMFGGVVTITLSDR
jgi:hypothetical protein